MNVNASTDYGDLLQYEWPQIHGDSFYTRFSAAPAPEAPDILWKTTIEGIQSFVAVFSGKVFVTAGGYYDSRLYALDPFTGSEIWSKQISGGVTKLDETHMLVGRTCLETETGKTLWVMDATPDLYVREEKMLYAGSSGLAYYLPNPSQPPTLAWNRTDLLEGFAPNSTIWGLWRWKARAVRQFPKSL